MQTPELPSALDADRVDYEGRAGRISYYVAGGGPPLLLVHSVNAAGSAYEVKPLFDGLVNERRVYALDLPGFGFSDRSARDYHVTLFVHSILDMLDVIAADSGDTPPDALALSLSAEFLARAACDTPARWRSLAMITPTGFRSGSDRLRAQEGTTREMKPLAALVNVPLWRAGLYRMLVRPSVIRYFLRRTWGSSGIDEGLAHYCDLTTHQPGAEHAPLAFLSGRLFSKDIRNVYEALQLPVWLAHGTRGDFKDFSEADWARQNDRWQVEAWDTGALPFFEDKQRFLESYRRFLDKPSGQTDE